MKDTHALFHSDNNLWIKVKRSGIDRCSGIKTSLQDGRQTFCVALHKGLRGRSFFQKRIFQSFTQMVFIFLTFSQIIGCFFGIFIYSQHPLWHTWLQQLPISVFIQSFVHTVYLNVPRKHKTLETVSLPNIVALVKA